MLRDQKLENAIVAILKENCQGQGAANTIESLMCWLEMTRDILTTHRQVRRSISRLVCKEGLPIGSGATGVYWITCQKEYKESYMCNETGVGSGSAWHLDRLFATPEEAQAEAERRNEEA
ncbi:hypothetical protein LCGC14_1540170 [marine sediment metagenome]|uniref:Uncharacterized protein n=1 Tax=marine sediment metagenome TaxID=412755 RepID=A0A0F9ITC7_9ZZZZ